MSSPGKSNADPANAARSKSPLAAAICISLAIATGTLLSTLDAAIFDDITSGKWLTRAFSEAQERQTASIAKLEHSVGAVTTDLDFVTARVSAAVRRNEDAAHDRFAEIDARIAALKERIAGVQAASVMSRASNPVDASGEVDGLRSSLHELAAAHNGAVSAITRRLDRIEVMVGISTDVMSAVSDPAARQAARRSAAAQAAKKQSAPLAESEANAARPERGHLFNIKPVSRQGPPLRLSRLPG